MAENKEFYVILDNGHGKNTPGKRSPLLSLDQQERYGTDKLYEWAWTREITIRLLEALEKEGIKSVRLVPEDTDLGLTARCNRANAMYAKNKNCILVSVHINAAPPSDNLWHTATGWSGWVSKNCSLNSKKLALLLYDECAKRGLLGNRCVPKEKYWQANFTIITNTHCPAVLTENLFQDSKTDVAYLLSEKGKLAIVDLHVEGIKKYISTF